MTTMRLPSADPKIRPGDMLARVLASGHVVRRGLAPDAPLVGVAADVPDADGFVAVLVRGWAKVNPPPRNITADALRARLARLRATDPLPLP